MGVNKVVLNGETKLDISDTNIEAGDIEVGKVAYDSGGNRLLGTGENLPKGSNINLSTDQIYFEEASARTNIQSGENLPTLFGKIKKWFSDLKLVAFTNSYTDLDNKPTIPTKTSQLENDAGFLNTVSLGLGNNSKTASGLVPAGNENNNKYWATDAEGNPAWRSMNMVIPVDPTVEPTEEGAIWFTTS